MCTHLGNNTLWTRPNTQIYTYRQTQIHVHSLWKQHTLNSAKHTYTYYNCIHVHSLGKQHTLNSSKHLTRHILEHCQAHEEGVPKHMRGVWASEVWRLSCLWHGLATKEVMVILMPEWANEWGHCALHVRVCMFKGLQIKSEEQEVGHRSWSWARAPMHSWLGKNRRTVNVCFNIEVRNRMTRVGQNHTFIGIYGVYTVFLAGKSPYIRSYTVCIYSTGQP